MLTCSIQAIKGLHKRLEQAFSASLVELVTITAHEQHGKWDTGPFAGPALFDARSEGQLFTDVKGRKSQPAIELKGFDNGDKAWASWRENWTKEARESELTLTGAALTFYWGGYKPEETLFRAEWTTDRHDQRVKAAHPHWHFDCELPSNSLKLDRIHFGMAGWNAGNKDRSECWQFRPADEADFICWAERTLEYSRLQLTHYHPAET